MFPIPATLVWSSSASLIVRSGSRPRFSIASRRSNRAARRSGPRCPRTSASASVRTSSSIGSRYPTTTQGAVLSTTLISYDGPPRQRSPGRYRCQAPSSIRWLCSVSPPDSRTRMCLPRGTTSSTVRPVTSLVASCGTRKSEPVSRCPATASCNRWQTRQTVSPSGIGVPPRNGSAPRPPRLPPAGQPMRAFEQVDLGRPEDLEGGHRRAAGSTVQVVGDEKVARGVREPEQLGRQVVVQAGELVALVEAAPGQDLPHQRLDRGVRALGVHAEGDQLRVAEPAQADRVRERRVAVVLALDGLQEPAVLEDPAAHVVPVVPLGHAVTHHAHRPVLSVLPCGVARTTVRLASEHRTRRGHKPRDGRSGSQPQA